jgi:hypothetical protein
MEEFCRILKEAEDSVTEAKKGYKSTVRLTEQIGKAFEQISMNMEPLVAKLDKTTQDAVETSTNLVSLIEVRLRRPTDSVGSSRRRSKSATSISQLLATARSAS